MDWPLGTSEDLHTEFKRAGALTDPTTIARAVVGFLNTEGGRIWIGFGETEGVADSVEPVADPDREQNRLRDALVDLVEPSPMIGRELEIKFVPFPADPKRGVLVVDVKRGERGPYALLRQIFRAYLVRTGSRLRQMTREEVSKAFVQPLARPAREDEKLTQLQADIAKWSETFTGLKMAVRPIESVELQLRPETLLALLQDPRATGNRPLGWNFSSRYSDLKPFHPNGYRFGEKDSVQWLEIYQTGEVEFSASLARLQWKGDPKSLWPFALLELPASVMRLARTLYMQHAKKQPSAEASIVLGIGIFGIGDWTLAPYSPNSMDYLGKFLVSKPKAFKESNESDHFFGVPIIVSYADLEASPDRCAYLLTRQVYRAFGHEEKAIPVEYNQEKGELTFPI
jgi:hypothetical protein